MIEDQKPIASPFGFSSTAADVVADIDLSGKVAVVTGGYSGLGLETVKALAGRGAKVFLPVRQKALLDTGVPGLEGLDVSLGYMDLADPDSIKAYVDGVKEQVDSVDILINNAGIMACPEQRTDKGYELQFATNHLGHFMLAGLLLPLLKARGGARVVALSSIGHRVAPVNFDDIHFEKEPYNKWVAYGQAKTANALFAAGLDARFKDVGVRAYAVHPGGIMTNLQRDMPEDEIRAMGWVDEDGNVAKGFKTPEQGAATSVWAATSPLLENLSGVYCEDCNVAQHDEKGRAGGVKAYAVDPENANRLWEVSEQMLGVRFS